MTIVNTLDLPPTSYPSFDRVVGDPFGSQAPKTVEVEDPEKLERVAGGLYEMYRQVRDKAADGLSMTPADSAAISTAVTTMAESVSLESKGLYTGTMESAMDSQIASHVTMESILDTVMEAIQKLIAYIKRLATSAWQAVTSGWHDVKRKARDVDDWLKKLRGMSGFSVTVNYLPSMRYLLVDGRFPDDLWEEITHLNNALQSFESTIKRSSVMYDLALNGGSLSKNLSAIKAASGYIRSQFQIPPGKGPTTEAGEYALTYAGPFIGGLYYVQYTPREIKSFNEGVGALMYGILLGDRGMLRRMGFDVAEKDPETSDNAKMVELSVFKLLKADPSLLLGTTENIYRAVHTHLDKLHSNLDDVNAKLSRLRGDEPNFEELQEVLRTVRHGVQAASASADGTVGVVSDIFGSWMALAKAVQAKYEGSKKE